MRLVLSSSAFPLFTASLIFLMTYFSTNAPAQIAAVPLPPAAEASGSDPDAVNLDPESGQRDPSVPSASIIGSLETEDEKNALLAAFHEETRIERIRDELIRIDALSMSNLRGIRLWQGEGARIAELADQVTAALQKQGLLEEDLLLLEPLRQDLHEDLHFMELLEERMEKAYEGILRMRERRDPGSKELRLAFEWLSSIDQDAELALKRMGHLWDLAATLVRTVHHLEQKNASEAGLARQMVAVLKKLES